MVETRLVASAEDFVTLVHDYRNITAAEFRKKWPAFVDECAAFKDRNPPLSSPEATTFCLIKAAEQLVAARTTGDG